MRNTHNLVIHESELPKGRGFSPVAWQVLSGKNIIPVCLFDAVAELDSGPIYLRDNIELNGTELMPEIRKKQGNKTVELCLRFLLMWPDIEVYEQQGEPDSYRKRNRRDDQLNVEKSIAQQFDHLRIVDNERYPAWFELRGRKYIIKILPYEMTDRDI
jgi:methionyl-tRNA formyltransferase